MYFSCHVWHSDQLGLTASLQLVLNKCASCWATTIPGRCNSFSLSLSRLHRLMLIDIVEHGLRCLCFLPFYFASSEMSRNCKWRQSTTASLVPKCNRFQGFWLLDSAYAGIPRAKHAEPQCQEAEKRRQGKYRLSSLLTEWGRKLVVTSASLVVTTRSY